MAKVYIVMGNDYPAAVFSDKKIAEAYCYKKKKEEKPHESAVWKGTQIYWRSYEFTLDAEVGK